VGLKCLSCGSRNKDEAVFCTKCGANLQKKCPLCGEMHTYDTLYCPKTGRNIKEQERKLEEHEKELEEYEKKQQRELKESMVLISGDTFLMGSKFADAKPIHHVTVNSFYIGKYPVTNKEYCLYDPSHNNPGDDLPVVNVNWNDAIKYCKWLSSETGKNYRLPTEAEWEYACRAGTKTDYYWGNKMDDSYCWYKDNSGNKIHPVGQKMPNEFGIYDMSGNLWEWCNDWYGYYTSDTISNPTGPGSSLTRVYRGGSWNSQAGSCRSAYRNSNSPDTRNELIGFRLVCNSKIKKEHIKLHSSQVNSEYQPVIDPYHNIQSATPIKADSYLKSVEAPVKMNDPILRIVRQGDDLAKQNQYDPAIVKYQRALRMNPHSSDIRRKLIDMCKNKGIYREAVAEYINWAEVCKRDGNYDEAIEIFHECLNMEKREVTTNKSPFFIITPTKDLGQVRDALTEYGADIYWKLGLVYLAKGNLSDAEREFKKSIEMNPANPAEIHKHLGLIYTEMEKDNEAIGEYQEVLRLTPDDASVYEQLGDICYKHHKDTNAIHFFSLAADIYLKKNEIDETIRVYENILKIEPENIDILTRLSEIYANNG